MGNKLGEARVVIERVLLGEKCCVKNYELDILICLLTLLAAPKSHKPPLGERYQPQDAGHLRSGICRNSKGLFKIYIQFGKLRVDSQETPRLEEALDFHVSLNNLKKQATVRMNESRNSSSPRVIKSEILEALREQPRLQMVFWMRKDKHAFSPKFMDFTLAEIHGRRLLDARKDTATQRALKKAREASIQNLEVRRKRTGQLLRDVAMELGSRTGSLVSKIAKLEKQLSQTEAYASFAQALRLEKAESRQYAANVESLSPKERKIRKAKVMGALLGYRHPALKPAPSPQQLPTAIHPFAQIANP